MKVTDLYLLLYIVAEHPVGASRTIPVRTRIILQNIKLL
jgi:hypothetical protein